jgi:FG-GAP repeat protein
MWNPRVTLILTMLTIATNLASAQLAGARFSSLPIEAQKRIFSVLEREVPELSWNQLAKLTSSDGQAGDEFGFSVAVSGDTVVVGIYNQYPGHNAAYVFANRGHILPCGVARARTLENC